MAVAANARVIEEGDITGEGRKPVLIEETKTVSDAIKVSEGVVNFRVTQVIRVGNAAVVEGTIEKQVFFVNTAGVKSHLSETLSFGDTVDVVLRRRFVADGGLMMELQQTLSSFCQ